MTAYAEIKTAGQRAERKEALSTLLAQVHSTDAMSLLLDDLCTPAEVEAMADRWWVVLYLQQGLSYREVHAKTGVSIVTIGRVARALQNGAGGYALALRESSGDAVAVDGDA